MGISLFGTIKVLVISGDFKATRCIYFKINDECRQWAFNQYPPPTYLIP